MNCILNGEREKKTESDNVINQIYEWDFFYENLKICGISTHDCLFFFFLLLNVFRPSRRHEFDFPLNPTIRGPAIIRENFQENRLLNSFRTVYRRSRRFTFKTSRLSRTTAFDRRVSLWFFFLFIFNTIVFESVPGRPACGAPR